MNPATRWFHNLALLKASPYRPWRHAIRLSLGTGLPLLIGEMTGHKDAMLFVALGAFLSAVSVRLDPYPERFRQLAISATIGATGTLIGPLVGGHGVATLAMLMAVALVSGLISGYGAAFSLGAMHMLVLAIVTSHAPHGLPVWLVFTNVLIGAGFVAVMLGVGALFDKDRPERRMIADLITGLAELARASDAVGRDVTPETRALMIVARRKVTDATKGAYAALIEKRSHGRARTRATQRSAEALSLINQLQVTLISRRGEALEAAAARLDTIADAYQRHAPPPPAPEGAEGEALYLTERLVATLWRTAPAATATAEPPEGQGIFSAGLFTHLARRLTLGRAVIIAALRLSLSVGIGVAVTQWVTGDHNYWLPLTVALVLKPDFGSVFLRAIHRSIGTVAGVLVAIAIAAVVPKGIAYIPIIMALAATLPFLGLRSYAAMVTLLTPVILLMIDLVAPGAVSDYGLQRLYDTLLGSGIALVFGYLIWPRSQEAGITTAFTAALEHVATFLRAATAPLPTDKEALIPLRKNLAEREFAAFRSLSDLRTTLERLIAEPPPAGREAASWFPAVASAERLCGSTAAYAEGRRLGDPPPNEARANRAIAAVAAISDFVRNGGAAPKPEGREKDDRFGEVEAEIVWLATYLNRRSGGPPR
ncbi:FUSC family protein [Martelella endophytica]|uniref:Integral membrane bound transporter domain-containing protein n=1 Tax=Martelella endophytica TaxID=1486262 RepID=A0A0D5LRL6_MAREN|nr:FUSC family protein [Martelella endophytica]AJY45983.1 hypothetical protein TM49_10355 [Martelella endophytica]